MWWSWQVKDLRRRAVDIDGPLIQFDYKNEQAGNVTLSTLLDFGYVTEPLSIREMMNIRESLCYDYDQYY